MARNDILMGAAHLANCTKRNLDEHNAAIDARLFSGLNIEDGDGPQVMDGQVMQLTAIEDYTHLTLKLSHIDALENLQNVMFQVGDNDEPGWDGESSNIMRVAATGLSLLNIQRVELQLEINDQLVDGFPDAPYGLAVH